MALCVKFVKYVWNIRKNWVTMMASSTTQNTAIKSDVRSLLFLFLPSRCIFRCHQIHFFFSLSFVSFVLSYFILVFLLLSEIKKRWDERRFCICTAKWIEGEGVRLVDWLETWLERVAVVMWQILSFLYCSWMHIMSACVWRKLTCGEREKD